MSTQAASTSKTPTVDAHVGLMKAVRDGLAIPVDFRDSYRRMRDGKALVCAELNTRTREQLLQMLVGYVRPGLKKAELIDEVYEALIRDYALGQAYGPQSYMMGQEKAFERAKQDALDALVAGQDEASLAAYAAQIAAARAQRQAQFEAAQDPKSLDDFRRYFALAKSQGKSFAQARMALTPAQRALMDDLSATETRSRRASQDHEERASVRVAGQIVDGAIVNTRHTQKGHDLFVVQLSERVSREDYERLNQSAKRLGGYYSSYRAGGAVPGFQFTERATAEAFVKLARGDSADAQAQADARRDAYADDRSQSAAERLTEMAQALEARADASLGRDRKVNTHRRVAMADAAEAQARKDKALAGTMGNIAQALQGGTARFLDRVRTKTQVELLRAFVAAAHYRQCVLHHDSNHAEYERLRAQAPDAEAADFAEFPYYTAFRSDLASLARRLLDTDGTKRLGERLMKVADDVTDAYSGWLKDPDNFRKAAVYGNAATGQRAVAPSKDAADRIISRSNLRGKAMAWSVKRGEWAILLSPSEATVRGVWTGPDDKVMLSDEFGEELVQAIGRANRRREQVSVPWQFESAYARRAQLKRMGLQTPAELRAALREFIALSQAPGQADRITALERQMVGRVADGLDFFPTPESVADEMIAAADIRPEMAVLEPSAGMGHIADRLRAAGVEPEVMEFSCARRELLEAKGYFTLAGDDFLQLQADAVFAAGDVMRAPDGTQGILRMGAGGCAVLHAALDDGGEGEILGEFDRAELVGVRHLGGAGYDRIVMNPPFSDRRDVRHVMHAYTLLRPGGRLVAIVGEGSFCGRDARAQAFRDWLDAQGATVEKLPEGSFASADLPVSTGANARMVVLDRPAERERQAMARVDAGSMVADAVREIAQPDAGQGDTHQSLPPEIVEQGSADPRTWAGASRWTMDRGAMPGEPFAFLDGDSETGIAAMREIQVPGKGSYFEVTDGSGNTLATGSTPHEAARLAEDRAEDVAAAARDGAENDAFPRLRAA